MTEAKSKDRSPSFPFIPLKEAVKRLEAFDQTFGRHPVPANKAGLAWGMKENSSQAFQTLAALKSFGLLKYEGASTDRKASVTDDGRTLLRAQQDSIKQDVLHRLATRPAQIQKFWAIWGADRLPDAICLDDLILKHGFTDNAARTFLKVYDGTVDFAGLSNSDKVTVADDDEDDVEINLPFAVGDVVNWESDGQIQWKQPRKIIGIDEHEDGQKFYRVEGQGEYSGQSGWIPVEQAIEHTAPRTSRAGFTPPPAEHASPEDQMGTPAPAGTRKAIFPVSEGDVALVFPANMSADALEELGQYLDIFLKKERRATKGA